MTPFEKLKFASVAALPLGATIASGFWANQAFTKAAWASEHADYFTDRAEQATYAADRILFERMASQWDTIAPKEGAEGIFFTLPALFSFVVLLMVVGAYSQNRSKKLARV